MRNIFKKKQVRPTDEAELQTLRNMVRWAESARILGTISEKEFEEDMIYIDWRISEMERRYA